MLIPSIDLLGGRIVQLVQGEKLRLAFNDFEYWIEKFARYPLVQLIDLDAAKRWYYSDDYQRIAAIRHKASDGFAFILQDSSAGVNALGGSGSSLGYGPDTGAGAPLR